MAILSNGKFYGFLCSAKETGQKLANGAKEYVENFVSGFAGHGWKIWKTLEGFFRLEIDELVVRRTMTVFELLIQKIRAVKGAIAITQANGKIRTVELDTDGTTYVITLEENDMSFVEHDYFRCQEFTGGQKFYHVEIESTSEGVIRVPVSEFGGSSLPMPGDEIVQFGNSSHDEKYVGRHSAIYMHADESGQPAIDVMFDIYEKEWTNCVKVRVGGDIPGSNGLKGFFCENGMIKCVDTTGHTTYCLHPNGTAELGDGAALFKPDKSGYIAGGAIAWEWSETKQKYVCSMKGVVLTWGNLDDETKENLKGEPGKDGNPGDPGTPGDPGQNGADGINGSDGTSIFFKGSFANHPSNPQNGWSYYNTTDKKSYVYQSGAWYQMTIDGVDGANGADGLSVVWKGDLKDAPANPQKNWCYRDTDNGMVYIYNGSAWELMVADGSNGTDGADGADGMSIFVTYNDGEEEPVTPTGDGASDGWHTDTTKAVVWMSQKVAASASTGDWGVPIRIKGKDSDGTKLPDWLEKWNGYATELGEEYIVTPKMFSGTKSVDAEEKVLLTGIAQGKDCFTDADGVKRTGIFALVDNKPVFELDPINKKSLFKGRVEADEGVFKGVSITDATITKCKIENVLMQGATRIKTGGPGYLPLTNTYTVFDSSDFYYPSLRVLSAQFGGLELTLDAPIVFELMNLNAAVVSVSFFDASKYADGKCNANKGYNWNGPWVTTGNLMKFDILTIPTGCCCTVMFIPKKKVLTLYAGDWYLLDSNKYQLYYHPSADDRFKYEMIPLAPSAMITV